MNRAEGRGYKDLKKGDKLGQGVGALKEGVGWNPLTNYDAQTLVPKNSFQVFFFRSYFNKKYVEVAINDFTMHIFISKWLRTQKCRQKRKTMRQRGQSERRNCQQKSVFIHASTYFSF